MRRALVAVVVAVLLTACSATSDPAATPPADGTGFVAGDGSLVLLPVSQRKPAPEISGTTLDGSTFTLADQRGKVVALNVWASWCAPCRAEAPTLEEASREFADQGVQFIGLDTRDSDAAARAFVDRFDITYPSLVDRDGRLQLSFADSLPPQAIPSTVIIDKQGRVAARALGAVSISDLRGLIEPLLAEDS